MTKDLSAKTKFSGILLCLLVGILLRFHTLDFQVTLSEADHGQHLYAFEQVLEGQLPYRDFMWLYGPLTPYYYALFFKFFGISIPSILLGEMIFFLVCGLFVFLILDCLLPTVVAFLGAAWFWSFAPVFYSYNHIAGVALALMTVYYFLSFVKDGVRPSGLWKALLSVFFLCFVKINMGFAALGALVASIIILRRFLRPGGFSLPRNFFPVALILLPSVVFLIYWFLTKDLQIYELHQCFPYFQSNFPPPRPLRENLANLIDPVLLNLSSSWPNLLSFVVVIFSAFRTVILMKKNEMPAMEKIFLQTAFFVLGIFIIALSHEAFMSGVFYRTFWFKPFLTILMFMVVYLGTTGMHRIRFALLALTFFAVGMNFVDTHRMVQSLKSPEHYLELPRARIYIQENPPGWLRTVRQTTGYLNEHLRPGEPFLTLPYEVLFNYLTDRRSPTRQLIFFEYLQIPPEQEYEIIGDLEKARVNYIVISSHLSSLSPPGLGIFGQTFCPVLHQYFKDHFAVVATFGVWQKGLPKEDGNYGTKILKRKIPLTSSVPLSLSTPGVP